MDRKKAATPSTTVDASTNLIGILKASLAAAPSDVCGHLKSHAGDSPDCCEGSCGSVKARATNSELFRSYNFSDGISPALMKRNGPLVVPRFGGGECHGAVKHLSPGRWRGHPLPAGEGCTDWDVAPGGRDESVPFGERRGAATDFSPWREPWENRPAQLRQAPEGGERNDSRIERLS